MYMTKTKTYIPEIYVSSNGVGHLLAHILTYLAESCIHTTGIDKLSFNHRFSAVFSKYKKDIYAFTTAGNTIHENVIFVIQNACYCQIWHDTTNLSNSNQLMKCMNKKKLYHSSKF